MDIKVDAKEKCEKADSLIRPGAINNRKIASIARIIAPYIICQYDGKPLNLFEHILLQFF